MKLEAVQKLCDLSEPYTFGSDHSALFCAAMKENIQWHAENSKFYHGVLKASGFDPKKLTRIEDCAKIPFIPANFFKSHELLSVPRDQIVLHATSSGTTGQKSQIFFDERSISAGLKMVDRVFDFFEWNTPKQKTNYLLYSYEMEPDLKLGTALTDNFLCKYAPIASTYSALRRTGTGTHDFDVFGCIERLKSYAAEKLPVRVLGFPAFLFFTLQRMRDLKIPNLKLSPESLIFTGGGWKGNADQAIPKAEFRARVTEQLGIPDHRIRDSFGSVEHAIPYTECEGHNFHIPVWSHAIIRDVRTLAPLGFGQPGFLQFITPYITSVPAQSVMMGDLASLHPGSSCSCGTTSPYFVIHGRAGTSKNKSCAIAASELLAK